MAVEPDFEYDLLERLTEARGVPGYEDRVRAIVREELTPHVEDLHTDAMGNVIGTVEGESAYSVVVAAHMDEIGFMVTHVDENGFLAVDPLGGFDPRVLKAQRATVHTRGGDLPGVIGSAPPHTLDEADREKTPKVEDVRIDLGLDAETVEERVSPGDLVTLDQGTEIVGEHVTGKAVDNRVSVLALIEAARRLDSPAVTVHFAATVQEEVGLRGANALGVDLDPDLAIALDTTVANDVPGFEEREYVTRCGEGVAIKLKDSSVITSPKVHRRLAAVAETEGISHQFEVLPAGGTDTAGFQTAAGAKPVGALSIPTRYLHTVTESAHLRDVGATIDLLSAFLDGETGEGDYRL
ncbi:M42 family metallopeptidase [Halalkalicoccus jeotgali]|uniref:Cellulase n=1 Tax=Halalkalicoccus jeotgali (strain DSM 18796 / CECT 7217 / JCM 14584 / KCTC 4019 / B3) TaxID=795797 RepID=D8J645_HALJB|nr:M42 family metallopeptidase [Halalkalicoccus jeotgali]ADJ15763.1 Cellulase [Halalkalicoccus jeotgali B3]ELY37213.1 Cellulase [Halalkalicoccus jeotgali B3]